MAARVLERLGCRPPLTARRMLLLLAALTAWAAATGLAVSLGSKSRALAMLNGVAHNSVACGAAGEELQPLFFVVYTPGYAENCGGCTVLHLLVHKLNTMYGRERPVAYIAPLPGGDPTIAVNPGYATPYLPPWINASQGVAVYPEIVVGNPLGAARVVTLGSCTTLAEMEVRPPALTTPTT